MPLPRQAQQQVEQADRILKELTEQSKPELELVENNVAPESQQEEAEVAPVAEQETQVVEQTAPPPEKDLYEERYKVLQGKYNSEVPRLNRQVNELTSQLSQLQATIAELQAAQPLEQSPERLITQEEIDEFGPDLVDLIGRKAKELYEPTIKSLKSEVSKLQGQLGGVTQTVQMTARDRLLAKLDAEVEDWQTVNRNQEFLDWLDNVDPYSGETRGKMLTEAYEQNDAARVVTFFKGFLAEHAAVRPTESTVDSPAPAGRTPSVSLEGQIAPGRRKHATGMTGAQREKRIWSQPEIAAFYHDVQKGRYRKTEDMKREIERDIISAAAEGRIR
jgi:hypothetical protein